jgi:hypothetical protein
MSLHFCGGRDPPTWERAIRIVVLVTQIASPSVVLGVVRGIGNRRSEKALPELVYRLFMKQITCLELLPDIHTYCTVLYPTTDHDRNHATDAMTGGFGGGIISYSHLREPFGELRWMGINRLCLGASQEKTCFFFNCCGR